MALVQKRDSKKTIGYAVALGMVVVGAIITWALFRPKSPSTTTNSGTSFYRGKDLPTFSAFGEDIYQSEQFKDLRDYLQGVPVIEPVNANSSQTNPNPFRTQ